jgi:hypothetical protein
MNTKLNLDMPAVCFDDLINPETGEVRKFRYREGRPLGYRLDLAAGNLNIEGTKTLINQQFDFIPIGYRIFEDALFSRPKMLWAEIFAPSKAGNIFSFMVNSHNVDIFDNCLGNAECYADLKLGQFAVSCNLIQKQNVQKQKYFVTDFQWKPLQKEDSENLKVALATDIPGMKFYRRDTITANCKISISENYFLEAVEEMKQLPATA